MCPLAEGAEGAESRVCGSAHPSLTPPPRSWEDKPGLVKIPPLQSVGWYQKQHFLILQAILPARRPCGCSSSFDATLGCLAASKASRRVLPGEGAARPSASAKNWLVFFLQAGQKKCWLGTAQATFSIGNNPLRKKPSQTNLLCSFGAFPPIFKRLFG